MNKSSILDSKSNIWRQHVSPLGYPGPFTADNRIYQFPFLCNFPGYRYEQEQRLHKQVKATCWVLDSQNVHASRDIQMYWNTQKHRVNQCECSTDDIGHHPVRVSLSVVRMFSINWQKSTRSPPQNLTTSYSYRYKSI